VPPNTGSGISGIQYLVLYEMLAGFNPFLEGAATPQEALQRGIRLNPPPLRGARPEVPHALDDLVRRCIDKASHRRPPSASEVLVDLQSIRAGLSCGPKVP